VYECMAVALLVELIVRENSVTGNSQVIITVNFLACI
jgi:hypothetical protein